MRVLLATGAALAALGLAIPVALAGDPAPTAPPADDDASFDDAGMDGDDGAAGDDAADDGFDDGFGDFGGDVGAPPPPPPPKPRPYSLTGFVRSDWGLWLERFEDNPFAKGRQSLDLVLRHKAGAARLLLAMHGEYDVAYLAGRDDYDRPTLDAYEWQVDSREALIAVSLGQWELTLGRQIVAFGEGDAFSPIDLANPRDNREPGVADLDDIRLPVLATRIGWFKGYHRLELMVIHEAWWGYRSPPQGPFSPFEALIADNPLAASLLEGKTIRWAHQQERFSGDNQQVLARWQYKGEGIDLGVYAGTVLDQQGVTLLTIDPASLATSDELELGLDHRRFTMVGTSGAWPFDSFLLKWELSADLAKDVNTGSFSGSGPLPIPQIGSEEAHLLHTMLGLTWTGVTDLSVTLEIWKPWLLDGPARDDLFFEIDAPLFALRVMYKTLKDRLTLSAAATMAGLTADQGWLVRAEGQYEIVDALKLGLGFITYQPGDEVGMLYGLDSHDRLFLKLRWDFQIL